MSLVNNSANLLQKCQAGWGRGLLGPLPAAAPELSQTSLYQQQRSQHRGEGGSWLHFDVGEVHLDCFLALDGQVRGLT
jgi:hypothetical protein